MYRLRKFVSRLLGMPWERCSGAGLTISGDVIASAHQDGVVFLHVGKGAVFSSNRVGARIWKGLVDREPIASVTAQIAREYGIEAGLAERHAAEFLMDLEARGILSRGVRS